MIRTLIIDDEPPARARMARLLAQVPGCEVAGEAGSGSRALEMIPELEPDLLLLDISMPGMDGMALARSLNAMESAPAVVFCTAWPDQALEAFDCDAVDYLVKPVRLERLQTAIDKVSRLRAQPLDKAAGEFLRSSVGGKTILIPLGDVICLVAEDKYTTVIHEKGTTVIDESLTELDQRFKDLFFRIHRNTLISRKHLRGLERTSEGHTQVLLSGTDRKPEVSRRNIALLRKLLSDLS